MKRKKPRKATGMAQPSGVAFEKVVARIQQMMDPNSVVTHNEKLKDRVGNTRQYDVVIRGQFGGRPVLGVMECKDHHRKMGPEVVEAFSKKAENLGSNFRIIVSKRGFTKQALVVAQHDNIGCLSLLPAQGDQLGFSIGDMWFGVIHRWENIRLHVHFALPKPPITAFGSDTIKWQGKQVLKYFLKELLTTYQEEKDAGDFAFTVKFDETRQIEIEGIEWPVSEISCTAVRVYKKKKRWVSWSGDGLFDWHSNKFTIPPGGTLYGSGVETDLTTWPDYEGELPVQGEQPSLGVAVATFYASQKWPESENDQVPDLSVL